MLRTTNYQQISPQAIKSLKTTQEIREAISGAKDYRFMDNQLECGGVVSGDEYKAEKQQHRLDSVNLEVEKRYPERLKTIQRLLHEYCKFISRIKFSRHYSKTCP